LELTLTFNIFGRYALMGCSVFFVCFQAGHLGLGAGQVVELWWFSPLFL